MTYSLFAVLPLVGQVQNSVAPAYYLYYESFTQRTRVMLSGADEKTAQKTVDAFYKAISAAQVGNA